MYVIAAATFALRDPKGGGRRFSFDRLKCGHLRRCSHSYLLYTTTLLKSISGVIKMTVVTWDTCDLWSAGHSWSVNGVLLCHRVYLQKLVFILPFIADFEIWVISSLSSLNRLSTRQNVQYTVIFQEHVGALEEKHQRCKNSTSFYLAWQSDI